MSGTISEAELQQLLMALRNITPLGRISLVEAEAIFAALASNGYRLAKAAPNG
jgi:hypothetical protein